MSLGVGQYREFSPTALSSGTRPFQPSKLSIWFSKQLRASHEGGGSRSMGDSRSGCVPEQPIYLWYVFLQRIYQAPHPSYHRLLALQKMIWYIPRQHSDQCSFSMSKVRSILPLSLSQHLQEQDLCVQNISGLQSEVRRLPTSQHHQAILRGRIIMLET